MLNEINDQAGQHEVIAENLSTAVVSDLSILVKSMRDDRRKVSSHVIRHQPHWVTQSACLWRVFQVTARKQPTTLLSIHKHFHF